MSITCAALMCHAPIVLPALGGARAAACAQTTSAMRSVARSLVAHEPDVLVVITPHAPRQGRTWGIVHDQEIVGSFARFGRADLGEKRDAYLMLPSLKVLLFVEPEKPSVTLHRRKPGGGFVIEHHLGLDAVIPLPEIDASLALADLYDRVEFAAEACS